MQYGKKMKGFKIISKYLEKKKRKSENSKTPLNANAL